MSRFEGRFRWTIAGACLLAFSFSSADGAGTGAKPAARAAPKRAPAASRKAPATRRNPAQLIQQGGQIALRRTDENRSERGQRMNAMFAELMRKVGVDSSRLAAKVEPGEAALLLEESSGRFQDSNSTLDLPFTLNGSAPTHPLCQEPESAKAFQEALREGLAGKRWGPGSSLEQCEPDHPFSPQNPARSACAHLTAAVSTDPGKLAPSQCCAAGFMMGNMALDKALKASASNDPRIVNCRKDMDTGAHRGKDACSHIGIEAQCDKPPKSGIRYLGCYTIGFWEAYSKCRTDIVQIMNSLEQDLGRSRSRITRLALFIASAKADAGFRDIQQIDGSSRPSGDAGAPSAEAAE
jgi:hypothetical protein